ncbi:MAG: glycoside hydrolase family 5 protein [Paludibacter sp.]
MNSIKTVLLIGFIGFCVAVTKASEFDIRRGTNISHFLSQNDHRGLKRSSFLKEKEVKQLSTWGFDHIRLPIDEMHLWNENGKFNSNGLFLLHRTINWCKELNLKVIVDLHVIRSHHFNDSTNTLWNNVLEQRKLLNLWMQLSKELKKYPTNLVAYELLNEPVAPNTDDWNKLLSKLIANIRISEPERVLVIGSNRWQDVDTMDKLVVPENDKNLMLSFHFYKPHLFTHYRTPWTNLATISTNICYPYNITNEDYDNMSPNDKELVYPFKGKQNKEVLRTEFLKAVRCAAKWKLPIYCGEFGSFKTTDFNCRMNWYNDVLSLLKEYNIPYANWDYKGGFGFVDKNGKLIESQLLELLTTKK